MKEALTIWRGATSHARLEPFRHHFRYPLAMIGIDLAQLEEASRKTRWLSVNSPGLFSFREGDFGARDNSGLRDWSLEQFSSAGIAGIDRVVLFCQPRILGYQFNPISLHFGYDPAGRLAGIIYEVHNTFGDAHAYVAPVTGDGPERHSANKRLHVSPFFDVSGQYEFRLEAPDERFKLSIRKVGASGPDFFASMTLKRRAATSTAFARWLFGFPLSTLFTIGAIHLEALKLWMKGARYHSRPKPPAETTTQVLDNRAWTD